MDSGLILARRDAGGEGKGAVQKMAGAVLDDIQRKRAEAELRLQRQQIAHLARVAMLGEFSAALTHELRQPLTSIRCNALAAQHLIAAKRQNLAKISESLQDIIAAGQRAEEIIQRMRSLLKRREPQFEPVKLDELVQGVLILVRSTLVERKTELSIHIEERLPSLRGDRIELEQVLLNLLLNACESMSSRAPLDRRIEVLAALDNDGRDVRISVLDLGTGIEPEYLELMFEPFFSTKEDGLGLGLSICRTIIVAHKGRLWAASRPDRGAALHFTVPVMGEA